MNLIIHLRIVGVALLLLATLNVFVIPKRFNWKEELERLSLLNRQIFIVHCLFIVLVLVMMGLVSLVFTESLVEPTGLARVVLGGLFVFWLIRLFCQWFVYDRRLWLGHRTNTIVHFAFTGLWAYFCVVFGSAWWLQ